MIQTHQTPFVRKKAILAACTILRKAPDTVDEFENKM
jgi:hypothetical protein